MSHMQWVPNSSVVVDGRACAQQAELLMGLVVAETNLVELQYHVMQCMHQIFPGNLQTAVMCHTFAYRILFVLSGRHPSRPKPIPSDEQARKLFWLASRFDKVLALCTGQPACIEDKNCDLTLPQGYVAMLYSDTDFDSGVVTTLCLYPGDLQKVSDAEVLSKVRDLDAELENWRMSIPPKCRPTLAYRNYGHGFDAAMDSSQNMHIITVHLEHHHLMATIHRMASRSFPWNVVGDVRAGSSGVEIISSQALCVETSRASLAHLRVAAHALMSPTFWIIVFYPLNAILTIFGDALLDPLQAEVEQDIKLLEYTAGFIKWIRSDGYIPTDYLDISRMDSFV
ncbi:hypothetical protein BKA61DRAFT_574517 [Leptodontidium sp. MPI-SDFR-AT-0119]|nr:hypothetical protein BKA61DRAFT_574517 [Leptodontidium sp. MPI-SDFR-AT-0119]